MAPSAPAAKPAAAGALAPAGVLAPPGAYGGALNAPGVAVSASLGKAGTVGGLSVPQGWGPPTPSAISPETAGIGAQGLDAKGAASSGPAGLLRGIPPMGKGRRTSDGFATKYGTRPNMLTRTPAAG